MEETSMKLLGLVVLQAGLGMSRLPVSRFIVRTYLLSEVGTWKFLSGLTLTGALGLLAISFLVLASFFVDVWLGGFKLGLSWTMSSMIGIGIEVVTVPIGVLFIRQWFGEFALNDLSIKGLILFEAARALSMAGFYLMYLGNTQSNS